jgi:hypothetical protein
MPVILLRRVLVENLIADRRQILGEFGTVAIAVVEILLQRFLDDGIEAGGKIRIEIANRRRVHIDD